MIPILNLGQIVKVRNGSVAQVLGSMTMWYTNSVRSIANYAYTPTSDFFLMYAEETQFHRKVYLYDFSTNPPALVRDANWNLASSKDLVYIPGTGHFLSTNWNSLAIVEARKFTDTAHLVITEFKNVAGTIEKIFTFPNPTNNGLYIGLFQGSGRLTLKRFDNMDLSC